MRPTLALLAVFAFGCGASSPPPTEERAPISHDEAPPAPGCPAHFGDPLSSCEGVSLQCHYPEGDCYCGEPRRCSGVQHPPEPPTWNCIPREEPCPSVGSSCTGNAECAPWCCGTGTRCVDGVWEQHDFPCPP